jgi:hypothetical protein
VIELGLLAGVACVVFAVAMVLVAAVKTLLWLVLLPLRLLFYVLLLPLLLIKAIVGGLLFVVLGPILIVGFLIAAVAAIVAFAVPLLPVLFVAFLIWLLVRGNSRTTAIAR